MSLSKAAIDGPKAHLIMGRRPIFLRAEGPFTSPLKATFHGPKVSLTMGRGSISCGSKVLLLRDATNNRQKASSNRRRRR